MRPIQWHLKSNWRVPESLEKVIPIHRSLHPHLKWWLEEDNVLKGQLLHPLKHALQIFTNTSGKHTARGIWSLPESKLHINYLELKAVFLVQKEFIGLGFNTIVLATDNTTVTAYINKGEDEVGPSVYISVENPDLVFQKSGDSQSLTPRPGQTIQTEWSRPEVFQSICNRWHQPQIGLFGTRFNKKLTAFVSPVPDPMVCAVDALSPSWEDLDPYAFPPVQENHSDCSRMVQHALVLGSGDYVKPDPTVPA